MSKLEVVTEEAVDGISSSLDFEFFLMSAQINLKNKIIIYFVVMEFLLVVIPSVGLLDLDNTLRSRSYDNKMASCSFSDNSISDNGVNSVMLQK